jgi:extracellular elastinolytic metalloproteinase
MYPSSGLRGLGYIGQRRAWADRLGATPRGHSAESSWNRLGTPRTLGPAKALATGLPADPVQAARQYLTDNQAPYGIDAASVATLDMLQVQSIGKGWVVLLRQRFGDLPAATTAWSACC